MVVAIAVQGRQDYDQWVTSYSVKYGNDGVRFTNYGSGRRGVRLHQSFFGVFNPAQTKHQYAYSPYCSLYIA